MQLFSPGTYRCQVTAQAFTKAKTGTDQFELRFTPLGMYNKQTGDLEACADDERTIYRPITDKTVPGFFKDLEALFGYTTHSFALLDPNTPDHTSLVGLEFDAKLTYETWNGKDRERWNFPNTNQSANQQLTNDELKRLDTLYGRAQPAAKAQPSKARGKKKAAEEPAPDFAVNAEVDNQIPF